MLENLDTEIGKMAGDKLIAFHMIGSHGPTYYQRYPAEHRHFMPECARSDIENCTQEQLVNTYDNTIRHTDYVLAQMIEKLKQYSEQYNTVLLYVSDHGESLGESGLYLHGTPTNWHRISRRTSRCSSGCRQASLLLKILTPRVCSIMPLTGHIPTITFRVRTGALGHHHRGLSSGKRPVPRMSWIAYILGRFPETNSLLPEIIKFC
jgi:hypothetical protein